MSKKVFVFGFWVLVGGLGIPALLWLVKIPLPKDFPTGGVLKGDYASLPNTNASLSDTEWLFLVFEGRCRPDDVPAHLTCQAWERYLENPRIRRDQELRNAPTNCLTDDLLQRMIKQEPLSVVWYLPDELINEQLLISTLDSWSTKVKDIKGFETDISRAIPKSHWSRPLIDHYFAVGAWNLEYIPTELIDYEIARRAVEVNGWNLKWVPEHVFLDPLGEGKELLWRTAVGENPTALQFVPWEDRRVNGCALSWLALEKSNVAMPYVPAICFRGAMPPS